MIIPMESKQIDYLEYDAESSQMTVHYHSGQIKNFGTVAKSEFHKFLEAPNKYDYFVKITTLQTQLQK